MSLNPLSTCLVIKILILIHYSLLGMPFPFKFIMFSANFCSSRDTVICHQSKFKYFISFLRFRVNVLIFLEIFHVTHVSKIKASILKYNISISNGIFQIFPLFFNMVSSKSIYKLFRFIKIINIMYYLEPQMSPVQERFGVATLRVSYNL